MPVFTPLSTYDFQVADASDEVVAIGGDLRPGTLLAAYTQGAFPMGLGRRGGSPIGWWAPDPRGVLRPEQVHISRSLRRSMRRFTVTTDTDFAGVVAGCADRRRPGRWITRRIATAYTELHTLGWAHSIEVRRGQELVGGLYGVAIGGLFAAESKFHRDTDASKVAVVALCQLLSADADPRRIIDVQWATPHLATLGVREMAKADYLSSLVQALDAPLPTPWR